MARQVSFVVCRVGAVLLWAFTFNTIGYAIPGVFLGPGNSLSDALIFLSTAAVPGLVGVVLWVFAEKISGAVVNYDETADAVSPLSDIDILRTGTALIGVYVIVSGTISAANVEVANLAMPDIGREFRELIDQNSARMMGRRAGYLAEIFLGVALFFGRERLASLYARARRAGVDTG